MVDKLALLLGVKREEDARVLFSSAVEYLDGEGSR